MTDLDHLADKMGEALTKLHKAQHNLWAAKDPKVRREATKMVVKAGKAHMAARRQYELVRRNRRNLEAAE